MIPAFRGLFRRLLGFDLRTGILLPCAMTRPLRGPGRIGQLLEQTMVKTPV